MWAPSLRGRWRRELKTKKIMDKEKVREVIARRAAQELRDGDVVNLGIGLPTMVPQFLPAGVHVTLQSENGLLGVGPRPAPGAEDPEFTDAGGGPITTVPGASSFDSAVSFGIIRGGHVDVTILGALQVDERGDLANWIIPGKMTPGIGGAMDLLVGARRVILAMEHTAKGAPKIMRRCTLPLTAAGQVNRIITEMAVIDVTPEGLMLREIHPEFTVEEVQAATEATLHVDKTPKSYGI
jgi:acetate CoA/acetoacetate CoA-transferase beta subunit